MKRTYLILFLATFLLMNCDSSTKSKNKDGESLSFLTYYYPGNDLLLGNEKQLVLLEIEDGEVNYSSFMNIYPYGHNFFESADINNNSFAMGLHSDFNEGYSVKGVFVDIVTKTQYNLPTVGASEDSDYPYFQGQTAKVSDNGFVLYLSATNDKYYGDEYRPYLIRFDPKTNEHKVAISPNSFVLSQPEKGGDTEAGLINRNVFISPNGRYAYGHINAYGVSGNIHWDYEILFQYDFETDQYERLGEDGENHVAFHGLTNDGKNIIYSSSYVKKIYNLDTKTSTTTELYIPGFTAAQINNYGVCDDGTTGIYYYNYLNNNTVHVIDTYRPKFVHFNDEGNSIFFTLEGTENNYICKTQDLQENTTWDTLATVSKEIYGTMVIK